MKALVYTEPYHLEIEERPNLVPAADQVLIRVKACGICGSDIHGYTGKTGRRIPPLIMGHEFAGIIEATGPDADSKNHPVGQRVTVQPIIYCGRCPECLSGRTNNCPDRQCLGVMSLDGAMAEQLCVAERFVKKIDDAVSFTQAAAVEPLAVAVRAVNRLKVRGKTILVVGSGAIGLMVQMMLLAQGAGTVIVSDKSDYRLERAGQIGAHHRLNPDKEDIQQAVFRITNGKGADIAIEAVGIGPTVNQALNSLKSAGQCVWIGNSAKMIEMNMQQVVTRELSICGTYSYTNADFDQALAFITCGKIDVHSVIDSQVTLEEAPAVFAKLAQGADQPIKCIITFR